MAQVDTPRYDADTKPGGRTKSADDAARRIRELEEELARKFADQFRGLV